MNTKFLGSFVKAVSKFNNRAEGSMVLLNLFDDSSSLVIKVPYILLSILPHSRRTTIFFLMSYRILETQLSLNAGNLRLILAI